MCIVQVLRAAGFLYIAQNQGDTEVVQSCNQGTLLKFRLFLLERKFL
jgi:hypothetical protein